jgi:hypothetical protein
MVGVRKNSSRVRNPRNSDTADKKWSFQAFFLLSVDYLDEKYSSEKFF